MGNDTGHPKDDAPSGPGRTGAAEAERYLEINGVWEDHVRYAMTLEEWQERRDELVDQWLA
jgi:hypothetical protein